MSRIPQPLPRSEYATHISIGDIHGNAIKLIYTLIEEGVLSLNNPEDYLQLFEIYKKNPYLISANDLTIFQAIIGNMRVDSSRSITLVGDELSDRGNNDYYTLLVLQKLAQSQLSINITLSNHSFEFIKDYERNSFTGKARLGSGQAKSLAHMKTFIDRGLINEDDVRTMVHDAYIPMVKAIDYRLDEHGELILYTHAPVGLETIEALAKLYNISYKDDSIDTLIQTIDCINAIVKERFANKSISNDMNAQLTGYVRGAPIPPTYPLQRLTWNRVVEHNLNTNPSGRFKITFVHGHIGEGSVLDTNGNRVESHINLDNHLGKSPYSLNDTMDFITRDSIEFSAMEYYAKKGIELLQAIKTELAKLPSRDKKVYLTVKKTIASLLAGTSSPIVITQDDIATISGTVDSIAKGPATLEALSLAVACKLEALGNTCHFDDLAEKGETMGASITGQRNDEQENHSLPSTSKNNSAEIDEIEEMFNRQFDAAMDAINHKSPKETEGFAARLVQSIKAIWDTFISVATNIAKAIGLTA